tara:strand:- start:3324 stop:3986 length:663 start_codon:yes stop_codon:yes gene_type:complete
MPSSLQVDKIIDSSATTNKELAEYSSSAWSWGSGVPAGSVIKTYHAVFKGEQSFTKGSGNATTSVVDTDYILVGTGASGSSGSPLSITCDTPLSNSSKYLITASITASNINDEFVPIKFFYNNSGVSSDTSLPDVNAEAGGYQTATHFGASHNSVGGSIYSTRQLGGSYLWSPSSSLAQTIMVKVTTYQSGYMKINGPDNDDNNSYIMKSISTLVIQEIA